MRIIKQLWPRRTLLSAVLGVAFAVSGIAGGDALAGANTYKWKMTSAAGAKGSPIANSMDLWAELIEKRSNGRIKVDVFYQGELGGQQELFDQYIKGNIELALDWPMTSYDPRIGVMNTPYLVLDWNDALDAYAPGGWLAEIVDPVLAGIGLKYFGPWPEGFAGVATRGRYATTVKAAKDIKVRSQPIFPFPQAMQALGYQAVPIDWGEVYTSIQTGVVDGDSGNIIYWDYEYFRDVVDYYVWTKHIFSTGALMMNRATWESLHPEDQKIVADAASEVIAKQFKEGKDTDLSWRKKAIESGMKFIELSPEEFVAAVAAVRGTVWPQMEEKIGKYIMDQIREKASAPPE